MTLEDLPQVMAIENASFTKPFSENLFRMELNLDVARLYVARKPEDPQPARLVAYIDYWLVAKEIHLITLAVHPEMRKQGIGSLLVDFMLKEGEKAGVDHVTLDVRPSNKAAIALYRKFGFVESGLRKRYYQDNQEDALILSIKK